MDTLIKWPGGKTREFNNIKDLIPPFERYVEPFFGGGAIFFQLKPKYCPPIPETPCRCIQVG